MKVKLLKKIRKDYKIVMFNKGEMILGLNVEADRDIYHITTPTDKTYGNFFYSYNETIDFLLKDIRKKYGQKHYNKGVKKFGK